jgi:signal transduction histidine kinase
MLCEKIFERSYTVSSARTPKPMTGSGLGLSIAKLIVERQGGLIWCESELGKGSKFCFSIPLYERSLYE